MKPGDRVTVDDGTRVYTIVAVGVFVARLEADDGRRVSVYRTALRPIGKNPDESAETG